MKLPWLPKKANAQTAAARFWLDEPDALRRVDASHHPAYVREALRSLITDGVATLSGAQAADGTLCDEVVDDHLRFCHGEGKPDEHGLYRHGRHSERTVNFQMTGRAPLKLATHPPVAAVFNAAWAAEAVLYTSLTFTAGTSQPSHRDGPHFYTDPPENYLGAWIALEDVHPDSGPLQYSLGSHRLSLPSGQEVASRLFPDKKQLDAGDIAACLAEYESMTRRASKAAGCREGLGLVKKGDVILWHPLVSHGGSPVRDLARSRHSMVTHWIPAGARVWNAADYFDPQGRRARRDPYTLATCADTSIRYVMQPAPRFQQSYL